MNIQKISNQWQKSILFLIKLFLFVGLFAIFFGFFYLAGERQIIKPSRTAGVTMTTFVAVGLSMTAVYGGFAIGKKKSKEIVLSLTIATMITDFITYFELTIMNVNQYNRTSLYFGNIGVLLLLVMFQFIWIYLLTYLGNSFFFKINPPERSIVIVNDLDRAESYVRKLSRYPKQYHVEYIITPENAQLHKLIRSCDTVFLFDVNPPTKNKLIDYSYKHYKNIYCNMELTDVVLNHCKHVVIDDVSMLSSSFKGLTFEQKIVKRLLDLVVSGLALIVLSPLMLVEALAIKCSDHGPVFYKQERLTIDGKAFYVLKFRTMVVDAEKQDVAVLASKNDSRITPVGKILRKTRMDELPQLINVFIGQMSIVGPRPERRSIAQEYAKDIPEFQFRLRAKAGLTGLAQIMGKYNTLPKDKLTLDLMYIESYSVWRDILLMFQTLLVFFKSDSTEGFDLDKTIEFDTKGKQ